MSKITIAGNSFVVTSSITLANLELVKKHRPKALKIVDEETREEIFAVGIGGNSLNSVGISFGGVSNGEEKLATVTMPIPPDAEYAKQYVQEKAGAAIVNLNRIEAGINEVLEEIQEEQKKVTDSITVAV